LLAHGLQVGAHPAFEERKRRHFGQAAVELARQTFTVHVPGELEPAR
jgi:hypothetical protein